jgi:hypothetical protein
MTNRQKMGSKRQPLPNQLLRLKKRIIRKKIVRMQLMTAQEWSVENVRTLSVHILLLSIRS